LGGYAYTFLAASTRYRLKVKKWPAEPFLQADPQNFEIPYSNITVAEYETDPARVFLNIYVGDLDIPEYTFIQLVKESYKGELEKFFNAVLPGKV